MQVSFFFIRGCDVYNLIQNITFVRYGSNVNLGKYIVKDFCICYNSDRQKEIASPSGQRTKSLNRVAPQLRDSSFLFIVAKHPQGYLLSLLLLSSHLQMRWQTTPAVTVIKKEIAITIQTPPSVAGYR